MKAHNSIKNRVKQVLILVFVITLGLIISSVAEAQDFHKAKKRHFKAKYKTQISNGGRECYLLNKKRNQPHTATLFTARKSKSKPRLLAEVDAAEFGKREPLLSANR